MIGSDGTSVVVGDRAISSDVDKAIMEDGSYFKVPYCHEIDMVKTPEWVSILFGTKSFQNVLQTVISLMILKGLKRGIGGSSWPRRLLWW